GRAAGAPPPASRTRRGGGPIAPAAPITAIMVADSSQFWLGPSVAVEHRTESQRLADLRDRYVARGLSTQPLYVARAEGARIVDVDGREYIDFAGGLACQNLGQGFPPAVAAIHEQVDSFLHQCAMVGMYEPYVEVCRRLAELSPCGDGEQRSLLVNSGAEAVENAVKIARVSTGRPGVVVFGNS